MKRWIVVWTKPNNEARALLNLERQGFSGYLPRLRVPRPGGPRVEVMFPRYLFALYVDHWTPILGTFGVAEVLMSGDTPARVPPGLVEDLQARANSAGVIETMVTRFAIGQPVRIEDGPFSGNVGRFDGLRGWDRARVLLSMLGREVPVVTPERYLA